MKHMRATLVHYFRILARKMDLPDSELSQQATIRDLCSFFRGICPTAPCPSDMQIRMAAEEVFKSGGYEGNCKLWITELTYLKEQVASLQKENVRLTEKLCDKSHA